MRAMNCHGQDGWMLLSHCIVVDTVEVSQSATQLPMTGWVCLSNDLECSINSVPEAPPPRLPR
jgi:hypothetical protein